MDEAENLGNEAMLLLSVHVPLWLCTQGRAGSTLKRKGISRIPESFWKTQVQMTMVIKEIFILCKLAHSEGTPLTSLLLDFVFRDNTVDKMK
jgi:hypothetical protein